MATGFGTDTWATDQIFTGRLASGVELVAQAIYRRLTTARGTLRDGDDGQVYGTDVSDFVGLVGPDNAVDALPDVVVAEILKDDRVERADVSASITRDSAGLATVELEIEAVCRDSGESFTLTLGVGDVTVALLGLETSSG
ncbi:MAG TPA: hypothetical protein VGK73_33955 [Polyangiaceae bacterium]